jgi:D-beta-D-heptose 7-phosphate kinase/D-beta-D-heptose 1-phosphate adenosyltransferase
MLTNKIKSLDELKEIRAKMKQMHEKVVFTNGVFDIIHRGHVEYLEKASKMGDCLFIGLNSDQSVAGIKGEGKPIVKQEDRAVVLAALYFVDFICFFNEDTPREIIKSLSPDVLVKGSDYQLNEIVGRKEVEEAGGKVVAIPLSPGFSTTQLIEKIKKLTKMGNH